MRYDGRAIQVPRVVLVVALAAFLGALRGLANAQSANPELIAARSHSGQLVVYAGHASRPSLGVANLATNQNFVRLEPTLAAVSCFGATDEWHQLFVPGRSCELGDWVADSLGGGLGLLAGSAQLLVTRRLGALSWLRGAPRRFDSAKDLILVADPHWNSELTGLEEATARLPRAEVGTPSRPSDVVRWLLKTVVRIVPRTASPNVDP